MLRRLQHPVLVRSFGAEPAGPRPYVVLEHLEGPRLSTLLRKYCRLPIEQLLPLGVQLCAAAHYMASEGVVHLDIKPPKIIMGAPARLIDLSVARTVDECRGLRYPAGTDSYMAPEQCLRGNGATVGPPARRLGDRGHALPRGDRRAAVPQRGPGGIRAFATLAAARQRAPAARARPARAGVRRHHGVPRAAARRAPDAVGAAFRARVGAGTTARAVAVEAQAPPGSSSLGPQVATSSGSPKSSLVVWYRPTITVVLSCHANVHRCGGSPCGSEAITGGARLRGWDGA
jgi:hypothetical protein